MEVNSYKGISLRKAAQSYLQREKKLLSQEEYDKLLDKEEATIRNLTHRFKRLLENFNIDDKLIKNKNGDYDFPEEIFVAVLEELDNDESILANVSTKIRKELHVDEMFFVYTKYMNKYEKCNEDKFSSHLLCICEFLTSLFVYNMDYLKKKISTSINFFFDLIDRYNCTNEEKIGHLLNLNLVVDHEVIANMTDIGLSAIDRAKEIEEYKKKTGDDKCEQMYDYTTKKQKEYFILRDLQLYEWLKEDEKLYDYFKSKFNRTPEEFFSFYLNEKESWYFSSIFEYIHINKIL